MGFTVKDRYEVVKIEATQATWKRAIPCVDHQSARAIDMTLGLYQPDPEGRVTINFSNRAGRASADDLLAALASAEEGR